MTRDELLRAWVEALESGKYTQGRGGLRINDMYCCLGVVCDLSGFGKWDRAFNPDQYVYEIKSNSRAGYLPHELQRFLGIAKEQGVLADANDRGESFPQIAQRIRNMFPDVFATVDA